MSKLVTFPPQPPPSSPLSDSRYDESIKHHITAVGKIGDKSLLQQTPSGASALDIINPALNTVSYVYVLLAHINAAQKGGKGLGWEKVWGRIESFLESFDARQIRYLGKEFTHIIDVALKYARSTNQPALVIKPLRNAILRLDPSGSMLTSTHLHLVKLALETRTYDAAVPVLDKFIFQFPGAINHPKPAFICEEGLPPVAYITPESKLSTKLKYQDVLEYFLYSGMVYIGMRKWDSALECLENAVTYPAREVSKIMVEAYKKWVLVGLLLEGKLLHLPRYTSIAASKAFHTLGKPYESVAQIFETGTAARLKSEVEAGQKIWQDDCNTGLIFNILAGYQKFQIRNLAGIYTKITIPEVNHLTTSAETGSRLQSPALAEQLVRDMIAEGSLDATLSNPPGGPAILTFMTSGLKKSEKEIEEELQASRERIQVLAAEIKRTDRMLTYDKEYLKFVQKQKKNAKNGVLDQAIAGPDLDWNALEDEDIMAGVTY